MEKQVLVLKLNQYEFMADILEVNEIIKYKQPAYVPNAPTFINGIIKNRDIIVPIIDLKKRFGLNDNIPNDDKKIAIIQVDELSVGLLVDEVTEIIMINDENIKEVPDIVTEIDKKYIKGTLEYNGNLIILLNLHQVLSKDEKEMLKEIG